jgi:hypothetical protein
LRNLIHMDRAQPSWIISHELGLDEAPDAYKHFDCREAGWTKVILHPGIDKSSTKPIKAKKALVKSEKHALASSH